MASSTCRLSPTLSSASSLPHSTALPALLQAACPPILSSLSRTEN
jgi:hypothetical protein